MIVETKRLILREFTLDDVPAIFDAYGDPVAMRFFPNVLNEQEVREKLKQHIEGYRQCGYSHWAAVSKDTGEVLGKVGILPQEVDGNVEQEIGYTFRPKFWRNGYATESAIACKEYGFSELGFNRMISIIAVGNDPSRKVAERNGMDLDRATRWREMDVWVYAVDKPAAD